LTACSSARSPFKVLLFWVLGAFLLITAGVAAGVFLVQRPGPDPLELELRTQQAAQDQARHEFETQLTAALAQAEQLRQELTIERSAKAELEKSLTALQEELGRSKDHLAFYEQLLPPGPQGAVALRAVEIERQEQTLTFRALLMRSGKPGERFSGRLEFVATGLLDGQAFTTVLLPKQSETEAASARSPLNTVAAIVTDQDSLALSFDQFQRSQGVLALPKGFQPNSVVVNVLSGDIVLASRKVDL
jgi:hypothetical protein